MRKDFWKRLSFDQLTKREWESVCDGCGKCCLIKVQSQKKLEPHFTGVSCKFLNTKTCKCKVYSTRKERKKDCITLTPDNIKELAKWLPNTCSYRLIFEKKELPEWHHLHTKNSSSVHVTGNSVKDKVISEEFFHQDDIMDFDF